MAIYAFCINFLIYQVKKNKIIESINQINNNIKPPPTMFLQNHRKQTLKLRLIVLLSTSIIFIVSLALNISLSQALYNENERVVPGMQNNSVMGTKAFMNFMNVVSMVFDPMICAGFIFVIYLISFRKLEIIGFLLWFFFLSWLLGVMKMAIHQARPCWIQGSGVLMESWTCYMDYGSPSGHSMLAIVLMQFLLRFYARVHHCIHNYIALFYILIFLLQLLIMFSRVMLGMHSFNQVLFGMSIGLFSFIPYYLFVQRAIMKVLLRIFINPKEKLTTILALVLMGLFYTVSLVVALVPQYDNEAYWVYLKDDVEGCRNIKEYSSFQYACLNGTAIISAGFGVIIGLNYMERPYNLAKVVAYTRCSIKFTSKVIITIVVAVIPLLIFLNPLWHLIQTSNSGKAVILWMCNNLGFFFATFLILFASPLIGQKLGLESYLHPSTYAKFKQYEVINMMGLDGQERQGNFKPRETELTEPKLSSLNVSGTVNLNTLNKKQ